MEREGLKYTIEKGKQLNKQCISFLYFSKCRLLDNKMR